MDRFIPRCMHSALILGLVLAASARVVCGQDRPTLKNLSLEELSRIEVTEVLKEATDVFRTPAAETRR